MENEKAKLNKHLDILYQDEHYIAVHKPHGLLVHRSRLAKYETEFALQYVRDQTGCFLYPIHRIDRKTAGVLMFGLSSEASKKMQQLIQTRAIVKEYQAIVRGFFPDFIQLDYPLKNDKDVIQDAQTNFSCLEQTELDIPLGKHKTSRYSFIECIPKSGRMHQIRKHLNHLRHPIIGDRPHGCSKQNRLFKEKWSMMTMMLVAKSVEFHHPYSGNKLKIETALSSEMQEVKSILNFS